MIGPKLSFSALIWQPRRTVEPSLLATEQAHQANTVQAGLRCRLHLLSNESQHFQ